MSRLFKDPLLSVTRKLLRLGYFLCLAVAALLLVVAVLGLVLGLRTIPHAPPVAADDRVWLFLLVAIAPALGLYGWFLRLLREIVDTVAAGTPFVARNAGRLARMGWLAVAVKLLLVGMVLMIGAPDRLHFGTRFNGPSLLMILVLFILARVFREGAAMREDLEGTV